MKRCLIVLAAAAVSAATAGLGGAAHGQTYGLKALLDAQQPVPPQSVAAPAATGTLTGTLTVAGSRRKLAWTLTLAHLSSRTLEADIQIGAFGSTGPIGMRLCGTCASGTHGRGTATVTASLVRAIKAGRAYVNVHTLKNPKGEVRGQIRLIQGA